MLLISILTLVLGLGDWPAVPFLEPLTAQESPYVVDPKPNEWRGIARLSSPSGKILDLDMGQIDAYGNPLVKTLYFYGLSQIAIRHESDPDREATIEDCIGRMVCYREPAFDPNNPSQVCRATIEGGVPPWQFRAAKSHAEQHPEENTNVFLNAMVSKGMSSPSWLTRRAATQILRRHGLESIPALLVGLRSKNLEVRVRCQGALGYIETGIGEEE